VAKTPTGRAQRVVARHGRLLLVERDILPPDILRALFGAAIAEFWDKATYQEALTFEAADRHRFQ